MEFDENKKDDPNYLIEYYKSRIKLWENRPNGQKIIEHYKKGIDRLNKIIEK